MVRRSQELSPAASGRVNQKRRTRAAIVAAARAIVDRGETPTIAQVAEEALMTRTTVYRYFPTQESLLLEVSVTVGVDDVENLLVRPSAGATPQERMLEVIEKLNRHIADNEALYRTALRHYNDQWLAAERAGEGHDQPFREGRRLHWIETVLAPLRDTMADDDRRRLEAALCLVMGGEAFTVLRDVCKLDADEAIGVANWAARVLLDTAIERPS